MTASKSLDSRLTALMMLMLLLNSVFAADNPYLIERYTGRPVFEVLDSVQQQGFPIVYSSQLVPSSLRVLSEPLNMEPLDLVTEILKPHGLMLKQADGIYLVVRNKPVTQNTGTGSLY